MRTRDAKTFAFLISGKNLKLVDPRIYLIYIHVGYLIQLFKESNSEKNTKISEQFHAI
jgi:hypothetical protein